MSRIEAQKDNFGFEYQLNFEVASDLLTELKTRIQQGGSDEELYMTVAMVTAQQLTFKADIIKGGLEHDEYIDVSRLATTRLPMGGQDR